MLQGNHGIVDCAVCIVTRLWAGWLRNCALIFSRVKGFLSPKCPPGTGAYTAPCSVGSGDCSLGHEAYISPQCNADVNACIVLPFLHMPSWHAWRQLYQYVFIHSFIPLACAECDDSLLFTGASSVPLCYIPFLSTLFHQLVFHPPSLHLVICFFFCLSALLLPNSNIILFWEFCFLPFPKHAQTNVISLTLLSLL